MRGAQLAIATHALWTYLSTLSVSAFLRRTTLWSDPCHLRIATHALLSVSAFPGPSPLRVRDSCNSESFWILAGFLRVISPPPLPNQEGHQTRASGRLARCWALKSARFRPGRSPRRLVSRGSIPPHGPVSSESWTKQTVPASWVRNTADICHPPLTALTP